MAARNAKPKNSFDSEGETEWTFIDSDEGTIETRKDSVTYRKATYSEILKGVAEEDLVQEVDSEPEFEVLASFKFRPKGESFGLGSSAPKPATDPKSQGQKNKYDEDEEESRDDSSSSDDGIMILSSHFDGHHNIDETKESNSSTKADGNDDDECSGNDGGSKVIKPDYCHKDEEHAAASLDDAKDDDDDFVITDDVESDLEEASVNNAPETDDEDDGDDDDVTDDDNDDQLDEDVESDEEKLAGSKPSTKESTELEKNAEDEESDVEALGSNDSDSGFLGIHKGGLCDNPNKDLDWDSFTFQLLCTLPRISDSTTTIDDDNEQDDPHDSDSENTSQSSYVAISQDDKQDESSSFDELSDSADVNNDFRSDPMIPLWLFDVDHNVGNVVESTDDDTDYIMSSMENLDFEESSLIIPQWFFDTNFKKENTDSSSNDDFEHIKPKKDEVDFEKTNPAIPNWLFDPNYKVEDLEESYGDYHTECSDSEYDSESDLDDSSALTLPRWLFDEHFRPPEKDEESFFSTSHLFVDIPTFIVLLCLTTALGFTIGHGLTVYFGGQGMSRNTKLQDLKTPPKQFASPLEELGLTAEEIAKIDLLKLEEELYRQKESDMLSEHLRFDLRELYKTLQKKHYRLLRNQKSTEDRLYISKTMSWYWRLKYDEEKRRNRKTSLPTKLRPKNFKDMATLAMKTKLGGKWRQLRKNRTSLGLKNTKLMKTNLRWLLNPLDVKLKRQKINKTRAEFESRFWTKASALTKNNDMKNFKRRWTQDFKDLKRVSCPYLNKSTLLKKKSLTIYNPFSWVNNSRHCKRANIKNDILGRCLKKGQPLDRKTRIDSTGDKQAEKESKAITFKPCFSKPKTVKIAKRFRKESISVKNSNRFSPGKNVKRTSKKGERRQLSDRQDEIHRERLRKRELKRKSIEVKNQVKELKLVLAELRRERRKAEKEKAELETSWRKLKRQRLQFEKEMVEQTQKNRKKVKKVKSKLKREKTRSKAWKNVAKRAQKRALALSKDLKRVSLAKKKMQDIRNIKKELKLEKRKLRKQQNDLISMKQQLRKEHRNYVRERWKTKKKRRELERQKLSRSETVLRKKPQVKKRGKTSKKRSKKKRQRERPSTKGSQEKKRKPNKQKRFWDNLEKSLYEWVQKINRTVEHHSQGKASKLWENFRDQIGKLINWSTGKSSKPTGPVKKEKHHSKIKVKQKNPVLEKILAEQMRFDEEKRNARKKDSEHQWKSRGPTINKERKTPNGVKRKKERKKKDPDALMKQRQRKQRRKYQRELERLQQWALQMNEKKLEHDRIYRDKEKKKVQSFKASQNANHDKDELKKRTKQVESFKENGALVMVEDSNSTLMLLLQPQVSDKNYNSQKVRKKEKAGTQDKEEIILGVTKSQLMHELGKKKRADTSLTLPVNDDIIQLPKDVIKGVKADHNLGMPSFREEEPSSRPEPKPPSLAPTFYEDFPIIKVIENANVATKEDSVDVADIFAPNGLKGDKGSRGDGNDQRKEPWYMRRAEQREIFRNTNPSMALFPRPIGPLKSDGTWFFHSSSDRALQRKLYEPLNSQNQKDGFKHSSRRSYFHRGGRRDAVKDGKWVFDRASDRAEQRSNKEPWYMRRAEGRKEDREVSRDSWFIERGFDRDQLHDYDEDDVDDDLMNDYDDYDDYSDHDFDEHYDSWL